MSEVLGDGPIPCPNMMVGEAPGFDEQMQGRGFVGKSGQQLWSEVKRICSLVRGNFYVTNIVKHGLPGNRDPNAAEISAALPLFFDEIVRVRPRLIVAAGSVATRVLLGPAPLAAVHGIPQSTEVAGLPVTVLPMYHPAAGLHNKGFLSACAYDLTQLRNWLQTGQGSRPAVDWRPSRRKERVKVAPGTVRWWWKDRLDHVPVVSFDTEGWASDPRLLSLSCDGQTAYVVKSDDRAILRQINHWVSNRPILLHNALHDIPVLSAMGITIRKYHDTQVLAYHEMLRSGSGVLEAESQNLGCLAYRFCNLHLGELSHLPGVDLENRIIPLNDSVRDYAGMDALATYRLFKALEPITKTEAYQIDMSQIPLILSMVECGIPFDLPASLAYYAEVSEKLKTHERDLQVEAGDYGHREFNPGSHVQVRELLSRKMGLHIRKRTKGGQVSTSEKALVDHVSTPFVAKLQSFRELQKLKGTYLVPLLEELTQ